MPLLSFNQRRTSAPHHIFRVPPRCGATPTSAEHQIADADLAQLEFTQWVEWEP